MKLNKYLTVILLFSITLPVFSQDELSKVGTGTAQFLKLGAGAHGTALGDAYTAMAGDISAMFWNPAGIQKIGRPSVGVSQTNLFADIRYNYFGVSYPINETSTVGLMILYLTSGDIEKTTIESPQGTGEFFSTTSSAIGLTISRRLTTRFDLGITLKYIYERLYRESAGTFAFDIGSQFDTGIYGMRIGMALANFGGKMQFDGPDLNIDYENETTGESYESGGRLKTEEWPIPLVFRLGIMVDLLGGNNEIAKDEQNRLTLNLEGNDPVDHLLHYNIGLEYEWNNMIALRGGYKFRYDEAKSTVGFGINLETVGIDARLDYSFNDYGLLGYVHNYSLDFSF
ncbi:MAG: PorV/PorQ family protein [Calditrichaceae bacterium]